MYIVKNIGGLYTFFWIHSIRNENEIVTNKLPNCHIFMNDSYDIKRRIKDPCHAGHNPKRRSK